MQVTFGSHKGKSVEELVLKEPAYILWCLKQQASGPMLALQNHAKALIAKIDSKPLLRACNGQNCGAPATRASLYVNNVAPMWWCDDCDPYESGANSGKLQIVRTFKDALQHVEWHCNNKKSDQTQVIKHLTEAKGMPARVTQKAREAFFA